MSLPIPTVVEPVESTASDTNTQTNTADATSTCANTQISPRKKPEIHTINTNLAPPTSPVDDEASGSSRQASPSLLAPPTADGQRPNSHAGRASFFTGTTFVPPSPSTEPDNPFAFTPLQLYDLIDPKNLQLLAAFGGTDGLLKGLHSHGDFGLSTDETAKLEKTTLNDLQPMITLSPDAERQVETKREEKIHTSTYKEGSRFWERKRFFGENIIPQTKSRSLLALMWDALKDKVLIILSVAAIVSLAFGLYEDFGPNRPSDLINGVQVVEPQVHWVEGVAIIVAIVIVVMIGAVNDYQKERQFKTLNAKKDHRQVKGIRDGKEKLIDVYEIVVGDILLLEPGDVLPADGVFLSGHNVRCDESAATGETDTIRKSSFEECLKAAEADAAEHADDPHHTHHSKMDPFLISGSKISEGVGKYVVTGIGTNSFFGKLMMALQVDNEGTPLQIKLNHLAENIAKSGGAAALLLFIILIIRFFVGFKDGVPSASTGVQDAIQIFIICVTVVVVAVPEGLPLAVTLSLAYATVRMLKDNNLVRTLASCETMGNATCVCSDKTGTLTQNKMSVVAGTIGVHLKFVDHLDAHADRANKRMSVGPGIVRDIVCDLSKLNDNLSAQLKDLMTMSIAVNSTAFEGTDDKGTKSFIGSKTETALLLLSQGLGWDDYQQVRDLYKPVQLMPFSSDRKAMGVVIKLDNKYRFLVKGASEILMRQCQSYVSSVPVELEEDEEGQRAGGDGDILFKNFTEKSRELMQKTIIFYASQSLRTIALCYRDYEEWPPRGVESNQDGEVSYEQLMQDLTLVGIVGIEDPLRDGVREAVQKCQNAGVFIRMVTGDNILTAKSIATQCGIYTPGGLIMEGPKFRSLSQPQMDAIIPRLQVLARSSPEDKKVLVTRLKELGEVVAVTGDGTNDGPALKTADVGFSMGIAGTEVAKEASDIILMDDNFASIVKAIMWGRSVNDSVKKFLQFQLTVNITAVGLTFISAVASSDETSVLTAVQLLWVNLIMDTLAALALATDPPTEALLDRKPDSRKASLITPTMWKMIIGQAIYQLIVTLVLYFKGLDILNYDDSQKTALNTLIFNAFVMMQIFNEINNRRIDNKLNIFEGIQKNNFFIGIFIVMVAGQLIIVEKGGYAFQTVGALDGVQWAISIVLGLISIPIGTVIRLIPADAVIEKFLKNRSDSAASVYVTNNERMVYPSAINDVRNQLIFFKLIRGGRLGQLEEHDGDTYNRRLSILQQKRQSQIGDPVAANLLQTPNTAGSTRSRSPSHSSSTFGDIRRRLSATRIKPPPSPTGMPPSLFAAATMVPSLVATSVGAGGWRATAPNRQSNPTSVNPSQAQLELATGGIEVNTEGQAQEQGNDQVKVVVNEPEDDDDDEDRAADDPEDEAKMEKVRAREDKPDGAKT